MTSKSPPIFSPSFNSNTDSDTTTSVSHHRHGDLSGTIFKSYTAITGSASPELSKIQSFLTSSRSGAASCLICLERIRLSDPTWSCTSRCFAVFHLHCIQSWARQCLDLAAARAVTRLSSDLFPNSLQDSLWNCPKCRIEYTKTLIPKTYLCFCGKVENPPNDPFQIQNPSTPAMSTASNNADSLSSTLRRSPLHLQRRTTRRRDGDGSVKMIKFRQYAARFGR